MRLRDKNTVIFNMDETSMSSGQCWKYGAHIYSRRAVRPDDESAPKQKRSLKCSLLGLICDDDALQRKLPQVVLPKFRNQETPPQRVRTMWADTGAPIEVWHRTCGWNTSVSMCQWIRRVQCVVREHDPTISMILAMDCFSVHVSKKILQTCRILKISVLLIPARCTWFLQPLDTHVFVKLKKFMRMELTKAQIEHATGVLPEALKIWKIGQAIHNSLVQRTWSVEMARVGLGKDFTTMRDSLHKMIEESELSAEHPTLEELKFLMGRRGNTTLNWQNLLFDDFLVIAVSPNPPEIMAPQPVVAEMLALAIPDAMPMQPPQRIWHENDFLPLENAGRELRLARLPSAPNVNVVPETTDRTGPSAGTRAHVRSQPSPLGLGSGSASSGLPR
jgi:hypothetical protein